MPRHRLGSSPQPRDGGATAVEFALLMPILFMLVFGILDYGMLFYDMIGLRQGAREAARQAVVQRPDAACTAGTMMDKVVCSTRRASNNTLGDASGVRVRVLTPDGWVQGGRLVVCSQVKEKSLTGFVPFPSGTIKTMTVMSIETGSPVVSPADHTSEAAPTGGNWDATWCG